MMLVDASPILMRSFTCVMFLLGSVFVVCVLIRLFLAFFFSIKFSVQEIGFRSQAKDSETRKIELQSIGKGSNVEKLLSISTRVGWTAFAGLFGLGVLAMLIGLVIQVIRNISTL